MTGRLWETHFSLLLQNILPWVPHFCDMTAVFHISPCWLYFLFQRRPPRDLVWQWWQFTVCGHKRAGAGVEMARTISALLSVTTWGQGVHNCDKPEVGHMRQQRILTNRKLATWGNSPYWQTGSWSHEAAVHIDKFRVGHVRQQPIWTNRKWAIWGTAVLIDNPEVGHRGSSPYWQIWGWPHESAAHIDKPEVGHMRQQPILIDRKLAAWGSSPYWQTGSGP